MAAQLDLVNVLNLCEDTGGPLRTSFRAWGSGNAAPIHDLGTTPAPGTHLGELFVVSERADVKITVVAVTVMLLDHLLLLQPGCSMKIWLRMQLLETDRSYNSETQPRGPFLP